MSPYGYDVMLTDGQSSALPATYFLFLAGLAIALLLALGLLLFGGGPATSRRGAGAEHDTGDETQQLDRIERQLRHEAPRLAAMLDAFERSHEHSDRE